MNDADVEWLTDIGSTYLRDGLDRKIGRIEHELTSGKLMYEEYLQRAGELKGLNWVRHKFSQARAIKEGVAEKVRAEHGETDE